MKFLIKLLLFILAAILAGLLVTRPAIAEAPEQSKSEDYISENLVIKDNAIQATKSADISNPRTNRQTVLTSGRDYSGKTYSKEEVIQLIKDYSAQYGISMDLPLRVAKCESNYNQFSRNSSSTASGVFQYIHSTWSHTEAGSLGISPFDADANVHMAIKSIASGGISNWSASKSCWSNK